SVTDVIGRQQPARHGKSHQQESLEYSSAHDLDLSEPGAIRRLQSAPLWRNQGKYHAKTQRGVKTQRRREYVFDFASLPPLRLCVVILAKKTRNGRFATQIT